MENNATVQDLQNTGPERPLTITLRVSAEERKRIRANAKAEGLTVSDYLRGIALAKPEHDLTTMARWLSDTTERQRLEAEVRQRELVDAVATGYRLIEDLIRADQPTTPAVPPPRAN